MNTDQNTVSETSQDQAVPNYAGQLPAIFNRLKSRNNKTNGAFGGKRKHNGVRGFKRAKKK